MDESGEELDWRKLGGCRRSKPANGAWLLHTRNGEHSVRRIAHEIYPWTATVRFTDDLACAARCGPALRRPGTSEAFRISVRVADEVGCRCMITDIYRDRAGWYARYGFASIEGARESGPQRMFLDCGPSGRP